MECFNHDLHTVSGQDTTPPMISGCPDPPAMILLPGMTSITVTWTEPTATDDSGMTPTVTQSHQSGDGFPAGITRVTYTFTDLAGNEAMCTFTVMGKVDLIHFWLQG